MKGYKAFNLIDNKLFCKDYEYKIDEINYSKEVQVCEKGLHFSTVLSKCYDYYPIGSVICEIEAYDKIQKKNGTELYAASELKIIKRLDVKEIIDLIEYRHYVDFALLYPEFKNYILDKIISDVDFYENGILEWSIKFPQDKELLKDRIKSSNFAYRWAIEHESDADYMKAKINKCYFALSWVTNFGDVYAEYMREVFVKAWYSSYEQQIRDNYLMWIEKYPSDKKFFNDRGIW